MVTLWDLKSQKEIQTLEGFGNSVGHVHFSPDGKNLACASEDGSVSIWDVATWKRMHSIKDHSSSEVWNISYSPDGRLLASGGEDGEIHFRDAKNGRTLGRMNNSGSSSRQAWFSPNGKWVITTSSYGEVLVWDFQ